jgi:hypothetical protein
MPLCEARDRALQRARFFGFGEVVLIERGAWWAHPAVPTDRRYRFRPPDLGRTRLRLVETITSSGEAQLMLGLRVWLHAPPRRWFDRRAGEPVEPPVVTAQLPLFPKDT